MCHADENLMTVLGQHGIRRLFVRAHPWRCDMKKKYRFTDVCWHVAVQRNAIRDAVLL